MLEVALQMLAGIEAAARSALGAPDPATGWRWFLDAMIELRLGALMPLLMPAREPTLDGPAIANARAATEAAIAELVTRAKDNDLIRDELEPFEVIIAIVVTTRPIPGLPESIASPFRERLLALLDAGMRPDGQPLPGEPIGAHHVTRAKSQGAT